MSLFGNQSTTLFSNPASTPTTPFGSTPSLSSSLFNNQPQSSLTSTSLFNNQTNPTSTTTPSLFGNPTTTTPSTTTPSLFGTTANTTTPSLFGNPTTTTTPSTTTPSLFGTTANTTTPSLFGTTANTTTPTSTAFGSIPSTSSSIFNTAPTGTNSLFGNNAGSLFGTGTSAPLYPSNLQPQPQQPIYTETTKYSDLPQHIKQELAKFNQSLFDSKTIATNLKTEESLNFGSLLAEVDQISSSIESLSYSFNFNIRSFKLIEESLMRPLGSINVQFNLLSTAVLTSFQQQKLPSREMEVIIDELVQKLERIKTSLNIVLPQYQMNNGNNVKRNQSIQQSFISTLDNNQRIMQSEAIFLSSVLKDLEKSKKQFLDYKQKYFGDNHNPFSYHRHAHRQDLKKQTDLFNNSTNSRDNNNNSFLLNSITSPSSTYGGLNNPISTNSLTPSIAPNTQTTGTLTNPTTSTTTTTTPNIVPTLSLTSISQPASNTSLFNPTTTTTTTGTNNGSSLFPSNNTSTSLFSTASNTNSGVTNPLSSIASSTANSISSIGNTTGTNSVSNQQSSLFNPPKTPILSSQSNTFLQGNTVLPSFTISNDSNSLLTNNRQYLSNSSSSIHSPKKR